MPMRGPMAAPSVFNTKATSVMPVLNSAAKILAQAGWNVVTRYPFQAGQLLPTLHMTLVGWSWHRAGPAPQKGRGTASIT